MKSLEKFQFFVTLMITLVAMVVIVAFTFSSFYKIAKEDALTMGSIAVKERAENLNN